jgi:hypothetical protein
MEKPEGLTKIHKCCSFGTIRDFLVLTGTKFGCGIGSAERALCLLFATAAQQTELQ